MANSERTYCCIDLKSFYASVECVAHGWDPYTTNLVVADPSRTEKTICLAVSPALKKLGVPGRCRLFEIPKDIPFEIAKPRMRLYMRTSARIVATYLSFVSAEDLHVYSIDECFIDLTPYISLYEKTPKELVKMMMEAVFKETGITATAGIGSNLFLAKVALDITAKHVDDNIGVLDEDSFKELIWPHRPITDIWQIGKGIARRLERHGIYDMGGIAHANIDMLYREFGVNAEYLIDHAWGLEPCTIADIHAYTPKATSFGNGQVLPFDYSFEEGRMILREMTDESVLDLVDKRLVTNHIHLHVGYAKDAEDEEEHESSHVSASRKLPLYTNSFDKLMAFADDIYCEVVDPARPVRRMNISFGGLIPEDHVTFDMFADLEAEGAERARQEALLSIKHRFGKDAVMKGTSLKDKARGIERAHQVGGHHE